MKEEEEKNEKKNNLVLTEVEMVMKIVKELRDNKTELKPHPNRILCIDFPVKAVRLNSGIELATSFKAGARSGQDKQMTRYFIAAIGSNVKELKFEGESAKIGDELVYCDISDAVRVEIPKVVDYAFMDKQKRLRTFSSFDGMEIHAIIKH